MKVAGCTALVTGANRGIGAALVDALLKRGAARVHAAMRDTGGYAHADDRVRPLRLDVGEVAQIEAAAAAAGDTALLINNAGISHFGVTLLDDAAPANLDEEMRVNFLGIFHMGRAFAPILARNGGGAMVNILSGAALLHNPLLGTYSCSKAAALSLTQGFRAVMRAQGTLVSAAIVGSVDTRLAQGVPGHVVKATPEAVAETTLDGVERNEEDIDTDHNAVATRARIARDPKKAERYVAGGLKLLQR